VNQSNPTSETSHKDGSGCVTDATVISTALDIDLYGEGDCPTSDFRKAVLLEFASDEVPFGEPVKKKKKLEQLITLVS